MSIRLSKKILLLRWFSKLINIFIRSRAFPQQLVQELKLSAQLPVIYVLRKQSLSDFFVLDRHCKASGLPRPEEYGPHSYTPGGSAAAVYLRKIGFYQEKRRVNTASYFDQLVAKYQQGHADVQIVPVSVFWGRNPGKEEKSLLKLLFLDDEHGGLLQKFFLFLLHGRHVLCDFGKPFSLNELRRSPRALSDDDAVKKLNRLLRVHFRRQREIVLGPQIYLQKEVIAKLLDSSAVREAINKEALKKNILAEKTRERARKYAYEVTSRFSHNTIRFLDTVVPWALRRIYSDVEVVGLENIRTLAKDYELVYMPCHRSHMDYLLLGCVLYKYGLMTPHTVAGINLNFWPVGPVLRRGGAIFIRRTFSGDVLYSKIVSEFVNYLIATGFPLCFYPEGGRSRTGLLLEPKTGIMGMVLESHYRKTDRPIMLVPVFISYDKLMESKNYLKELGGKKKRQESLGSLIKAGKILRSNFGKAYLNFGVPLDLGAHLSETELNGEISLEGQRKLQLKAISREVMVRINQAGLISPSAMLALILLATPKKALGIDNLLVVEQLLLRLVRTALPDHHGLTTYASFAEALGSLEELLDLERFTHPSGDILYVQGATATSLHYYRNNIVHFFIFPSILANLLRHSNGMSREQILKGTGLFYGFFTTEYYLPEQEERLPGIIEELLVELTDCGLVVFDEEWQVFRRPNVLSDQFSYFKILCSIFGGELERIAIYSLTITRYGSGSRMAITAISEECNALAKRLSLLSEAHGIAGLSEGFAPLFLANLATLGFVTLSKEQVTVKPAFMEMRSYFLALLSWDIASSFKSLHPVESNMVDS